MSRLVHVLLLGGLVALVAPGCTPKYPNCEKDSHCRQGEFCVNKKCQQCRNDKDCEKGQECKSGACQKIPGYCETAADCPNQGACKNNRCVPCTSDADCGAGAKCKSGRCLQPGQCVNDDDCPANHECQNGTCVAPPKPAAAGPCTPEPVYFDFNEFVLTSSATAALQKAAECIKKVSGRTIRLEGHCDPRGTEEYNLALGDRRARAVRKYLRRLGISTKRMRPVSKGKLEATGTGPSSWARDRKVLFVWE
ncbi:MAG: OmpA family protein [Myxococcales bacterium]|nr:OmpA family protein [Myxococcales bacterium]